MNDDYVNVIKLLKITSNSTQNKQEIQNKNKKIIFQKNR